MRDDLRRFNMNPEGKHQFSGPCRVEVNAGRVLALLQDSAVECTRDCIQIDSGGEKGIVILVTPEAIELRFPTIEWTKGAYGPVASSKLWKRIEVSKINDTELDTLLKEAIRKRQNEFRNCRYCRKSFPPERMHNSNVCHGCAEEHLGVVH